MNILVILVPCSLVLGLGALIAFVWTLRHDQYDDPDGDAARILLRDDGPSESCKGRERTGRMSG